MTDGAHPRPRRAGDPRPRQGAARPPGAAARRRGRGGRRAHRPLPRDDHHQGRPAPPGVEGGPLRAGRAALGGGDRVGEGRGHLPARPRAPRHRPGHVRDGRQLGAQRRAARARASAAGPCTCRTTSPGRSSTPSAEPDRHDFPVLGVDRRAARLHRLADGRADDDASSRVASFNIHWGRGLRWLGLPAVRRGRRRASGIDADVLVLQELGAGRRRGPARPSSPRPSATTVVVAPLARAVVDPSPRVVDRADPSRAQGRPATGAWPLLSRLPGHLHRRSTPLPQLPTRSRPTAVVLRGRRRRRRRPLAVHGTHLPHLEMGVAAHTRRLRARARARPTSPAVLLGDMNMWGWCIIADGPDGLARAGAGPHVPVAAPGTAASTTSSPPPSVEVRRAEVAARPRLRPPARSAAGSASR